MLGEGVQALLTSDALSTAALASAHAQLVEGRPVRLTVGEAASAASTQNPGGPLPGCSICCRTTSA
jgi:hypothetical protein